MKKVLISCMALMLALVGCSNESATTPSNETSFDESADIVIIGAGGAGLRCCCGSC